MWWVIAIAALAAVAAIWGDARQDRQDRQEMQRNGGLKKEPDRNEGTAKCPWYLE
jgi:hypothetical protein